MLGCEPRPSIKHHFHSRRTSISGLLYTGWDFLLSYIQITEEIQVMNDLVLCLVITLSFIFGFVTGWVTRKIKS